MTDIIIIVIIAAFVVYGSFAARKHFNGQGGCCGSGSAPVKKKKLKHVIAKKTIVIEGMTCENCKNRVERYLNDLDNVSASVNLRRKEAVVSLAAAVSDEQLKCAVEKGGYQVVEIR